MKCHTEHILVWNTTRPRSIDHEATEFFIKLVKNDEIQSLLKDKKTQRVYEEMLQKGYRVADTVKEGGSKCNQKWRNLEKNYSDFIINASPKASGISRKDTPPYYDLLHTILANKHTVKPPIVLDTLNIASLQNTVDTFEGSTECEEKSIFDNKPPTKRFKKVKRITKPPNPILIEIQRQHKEDMEVQKQFIDLNREMIDLQREQNKTLSHFMNYIINKK